MKTILHKAASRGHANHGWLNTFHTFSFADYYDKERMGFGVLRVINDDTVAPGEGFGTHPHHNMEIISIPLAGKLQHADSMGYSSTIEKGEVQVMSAGTGITHSEMNASTTEEVKFLQIWVIPNKRAVEPRYGQLRIAEYAQPNKLQQIVSPNSHDPGVWIHQDAWFHLGTFDSGLKFTHTMQSGANGLYIFVISGQFQISDELLDARDGLGVYDVEEITITSKSPNSEILIMEVPMR